MVLLRNNKVFTIDIEGNWETVSINRLEVAYLHSSALNDVLLMTLPIVDKEMFIIRERRVVVLSRFFDLLM